MPISEKAVFQQYAVISLQIEKVFLEPFICVSNPVEEAGRIGWLRGKRISVVVFSRFNKA